MNGKQMLGLGVLLVPNLVVADNLNRPNIVIIYADDLGWGDVSYHGMSDVHTPHIDALARGGVEFTQGYVSASVSGPSRAGLLSGCFQARFGFYGNSQKCFVPQSHDLLPEIMQKAGYSTGMVGKWHGDALPEYSPKRGFDYFYGIYGGHDYFKSGFNPKNKRTQEKPLWINDEMDKNTLQASGDYLTDRFTNKATDFIEQQKDDPFFLYVAYNAVHHPWQAPQKYIKQLDDLEVHHPDRRVFAAMVLALDAGVGKIIETLKKEGKYDNTLIFFISDNGSPRGQGIAKPNNDQHKERGGTVMSNPGPYRGFKGDVYEGGIRTPFIAHWKKGLPAGTQYHQPVMNIDVYPTVAALAGAKQEKGLEIDGVNLLPYILNECKRKNKAPHDVLFWRRDDDFAIRKGDWKLQYNDQGNTRTVELFNIRLDAEEHYDVYEDHVKLANKMLAEFDAWDSKLPPYPYRSEPASRNTTGRKRTVEELKVAIKTAPKKKRK